MLEGGAILRYAAKLNLILFREISPKNEKYSITASVESDLFDFVDAQPISSN